MSPRAVTQRLRRVAELVRICRALAGSRRRAEGPQTSARETSQSTDPRRVAAAGR